MKISIVGDTHFGYERFYEDSFKQGREAIIKGLEKGDLLIHAGDMFDTRIPSFETLERVVRIFREASAYKKPILAIHGNHERRIKGYINPIQLIASSGLIKYLHGDVFSFEKEGERVNVLGIGSVPEDKAKAVIEKVLELKRGELKEGINILLIHQMIKELDPSGESELSMDYLESLGFDYIINGHIHKRLMEKRLVIPGSTVVTSLEEGEIKERRGFVVLDTKSGNKEFVEINQREIKYSELELENASYEEIIRAVEKEYYRLKGENEEAIVRIVLKGTLKEGLNPSLISIPTLKDLYIKNKLKSSLKEELDRAKESFRGKDVNRWAEEEIKTRLKDKVKDLDRIMQVLYELEGEEALGRLLDEE